MTVTDEDRALAEFLIGGTFTEADADEIAAHRQAAYAAGLERAAVIAPIYAGKAGMKPPFICCQRCSFELGGPNNDRD